MKRFVHKQTIERLEKLDSAFQDVEAEPEDPGPVHHLRVAIRRVVQCLRFFEDCFEAGAVDKVRRPLRSVLKRCGAVRNCDVTLKLLGSTRVRDTHLKKALQTQRLSAQEELASRLDRWRPKHARKLLHVVSSGKARRRVPSKVVKEWAKAGDAAAKDGDPESLHRFRLLGKRLRYSLELFPDADEALLDRLRSVQDQLGAINDCATALPLVQGHPKAEAALTRMLHARQRKFHTSWVQEIGAHKKGAPWKSTSSDTAKPSRAAKERPKKSAN